MRRLAVTMVVGLLLLGGVAGAEEGTSAPKGASSGAAAGAAKGGAGGKKVSCKQIKEALAGGKTAQQVASELGVREKRIRKCTTGRKADGAAKQPAPTAAP